MDYILLAVADYLPHLVVGLCVICVLQSFITIILAVTVRSLRTRMNRFFGTRSEKRNLEAILQELKARMVEVDARADAIAADMNDKYDAALSDMTKRYKLAMTDSAEKYEGVLALIDNINERLVFCVQRVGVVRYNPFEHIKGGDQSFAVALLDEASNGVVFSTIHGRDASYTYVKPVVGGESSYPLTNEERRAIARAANQNKLIASYPD